MTGEDRLRGIVATEMVEDSSLARSLLVIAEALGEQRVGTEALTERVERVEEEQFVAQALGATTAPVARGGVHELAPLSKQDRTGFSGGRL